MSLREFLSETEGLREVVHIEDPVSPRFEVSKLAMEFDGGPILFFENVEGRKVVVNVCGSRDRICLALKSRRRDVHRRLVTAMHSLKPPEVVNSAPSQEEVEKPDLGDIPILTHFEKDGGPYITSGVIYARSPKLGVENVSIHRLQVLDDSTLAIRLVPRHLYKLWTAHKMEKKDLEVSISIGVHPTVHLAAASSPPFGVNEFHIANSLLAGGLKLVKCLKVDAYAPAEAELTIEGAISWEKEVLEGPLVDILGTYDVQRMQPIVEVKAVTHRRNYVYQAIVPSSVEHKLLMGLPREALIWEAVSKVVPEVYGVRLTMAGGGWLHAVISIRKQKEGDGKNALLAAFAAHPSLKHAVVVDEDIDVYDSEAVEWAIATRFQADRDLIVVRNARGSTLDPSSDQERVLTSKVGIDATKPMDKPKESFELARIPSTSRVEELIKGLRETIALRRV
ncbi:UbiD family decarboxylase [Candidatus Bathyarchaeota archaeon]|nr:UbiD family decarboxylase [Candidatus Bathyarchaeota archaeon]